MEFLSEDPTYLAGGLVFLGLVLLIALRVTQQGRYLVWAGAALALALVVIVVEHVWITDAEQIEQVVYSLRRAVQASDVEGVDAQLTPDVQFVRAGSPPISGQPLRHYIKNSLEQTRFDFVRISRLRASAGRQTRRGVAEFRVMTGGTYQRTNVALNFGATNLDFSLGLRETGPDVWKVERITQINTPREMPMP